MRGEQSVHVSSTKTRGGGFQREAGRRERTQSSERALCQRVGEQPAGRVPNVPAVETLYCSVQSPNLTVIRACDTLGNTKAGIWNTPGQTVGI